MVSLNLFVKLTTNSVFSFFLQTILATAQPRPHSHPPPVKAREQAKPAALVDLLSLDTPAPAPVPAPVPASVPATSTSAGLLNSLAQPPASQPAKTAFNEVKSQDWMDAGCNMSLHLTSVCERVEILKCALIRSECFNN